jgi:hypothetical protein
MRKFDKRRAVEDFFDVLDETGVVFPKGDYIGWRMAWNEHFDRLCRAGVIPQGACDRGWLAPKMPRRFQATKTRHVR